MSDTKPSVSPQNTGVAAPENSDPAVTPVVYPQTLSNGDILLEVLGDERHRVKIVERTDPSQFIRYLADCSCGVQGRGRREKEVRAYAQMHLERRGVV